MAERLVAAPFTLRARISSVVVPVAWWTGCAGLAAVAACGVLWTLPDEAWPTGLDPARLPVYTMASLVVASLAGWGCLHQGEGRLRRVLPNALGVTLFVVLPLACVLTELLADRGVVTLGEPWLERGIRWYPITVVAVSLLALLTWKARPRKRLRVGRGAWFLVVTSPYALLTAYLAIGLGSRWFDEPLAETADALGSWGMAFQLAVGWFLAEPAEV